MKSSKFSWFRSGILFALAGVLLFATSLQDAHYLFVEHHFLSENHPGANVYAGEGFECNLCKIELAYFIQTCNQFELSGQVFLYDYTSYPLSNPLLTRQLTANSLRGPPLAA